MYKKVLTDLKFVDREKNIEKFWEEKEIFSKTISSKDGKKHYTFYDGPPTANGKPHIGHVLTRVIKDMIPRYHTMKGAKILRKAGWDTHGLPVEIEVEKKLGLDGKEQIEIYGLEKFIEECKKSVWKYKGMWEDFSKTVGFFVDMDDPYITYSNNYIESVWWSLKEIYKQNLLYKGFKTVPYCPRCGTPLSSHEVAQGYKEVKEKSVIAKFKLRDEDNTYFLAWTTTPWTLPSNLALCVNKNYEYVKVEVVNKHNGLVEYLILAKELLSVIDTDYKIVNTYLGSQLENTFYEPLYKFKDLEKMNHFIVSDDYVSLTDGTGIVHIAPAFGEDDNRIGKKYNLDFLQLVNSRGEMTSETLWPNVFCKDADKLIIEDLKNNNKLYKTLSYIHSYPHCWRCDSPLIYYAKESWFIKMTSVKEEIIKNNQSINWIPQSIGLGRFGDWLNNIQDWSISRDRYWGTPLNIWECSCKHTLSVGSIEELKSLSINKLDEVELHKPFIDKVLLRCPKCNKEMTRVKEVIDCWYDSGAMPFAQWHYPFENQETFENNFPADFISEAVDQTRGWFYSLLAISTLVFKKAPFKNCIVLGHVQDENGQKMSKSKGNAVDPFEALETYGADAIRWYFYSNSAPWLPNRFHGKIVVEGQRKVMGTLWNTYAFYCLYANIDKFNPSLYELNYETLNIMDKWIISKLNSLVDEVDTNLTEYKIVECTKVIEKFIDELSNWYVRRNRERFWESSMSESKINAYKTLYEVLVTLIKVLAPFLPFITEEIYQNLVLSVDSTKEESIHLCSFPVCNKKLINKKLEEEMEEVLELVVLGRNLRSKENIKNRQPLSIMYVKGNFLDKVFLDIIKNELNIKKIEFIDDIKDYSTYKFKPNFKTLKEKYPTLIGQISSLLQNVDPYTTMEKLNNSNFSLEINNQKVDILKEDLLIETIQAKDYAVVSYKNYFVAIKTTLTDQLIEEGIINEIVSKVQTMRKDAGFEVVDNINLYISKNEYIESLVLKNKDYIKSEVLGKEIIFSQEETSFNKEWDINGNNIYIGVKVI